MTGFSTTPRAREAARSRVSPIMINDNVVDVLVQPGKAAGEPAFVSFRPPTQFVTMDAEVKTVAEEQAAELKVGSIDSRRFTVRGSIPAGHHRLVRIHEVDDPASFARALFIEALRRQNVRVNASFLGENTTASLAAWTEVARFARGCALHLPSVWRVHQSHPQG